MMTDVTQTYRGDHFTVCTDTKSLCCALENNKMNISIIPQFLKNKEKEKKENAQHLCGQGQDY